MKRVPALNRIYPVLASFEKISFSDLLVKSRVSRPILATYLKELLQKKLIIQIFDEKDKRRIYYSLNPEELLIATYDDVINSVRKELENVGEKLEKDEEEILRRILRDDIRSSILEDLKRGELILNETGYILNYITYLTLNLEKVGSTNFSYFAFKWIKTDFAKKFTERYFGLDRFKSRLNLYLEDLIDLKRGVELNAFLSKKSKLLLDLMLKNGELEVRDGFVFLTDKGVERVVERMKREIERLLVNLNLLGVDVDKLCDEVVRKAKNTIIFRETFERKNASE